MEEVIIYAYSAIGEAVYQECIRQKIPVLCFCEDSIIQKNKANSKVDIFSLEEIIQRGLDGKFIICIPNAKPVITKLERSGYKNWVLAADYLVGQNYIQNIYTLKSKEIAIREIESCILSHQYLQMPDKLFVRNIDLEITERCSMRCRDCSNLMQYYKNPKDYAVETLIGWVDVLLKYVDEIYEVRILGGEPFMHRDIHQIIKKIISYPQVHRVLIFTNATIMPTKEMWDVMENVKVGFDITDYGQLSRNLMGIKRELDKRNIAYNVKKAGGWTKCSDIIKHGRDKKALKELYNACCVKNLATLLNGRIYKCPYIANGVNLRAIPVEEKEFVDLEQLEQMGLQEAKKALIDYLNSKQYFASCDYCNGRTYDAEEIEPAVQISEPMNYTVIGG